MKYLRRNCSPCLNKSLASLSYAMGTNLLRHGIVANLSSKEIRFEEN